MREYVEFDPPDVDRQPRITPIEYEGEIITIRDYRRVLAPPCEPPPIYLAAVQPAMLQLSGEIADGLLANLLNTPRYFTDIVHPNGRGRARQGLAVTRRRLRALRSLKVCSVDRDRQRARKRARAGADRVLFLRLPYFDQVLDPAGFTREKLAIRDAWARADLAAMTELVTDDMVDALVLAGTPDDVRGQLDRFEGLFETVLLYCPMPFIEREESLANHEAMIDAFAD